MSLTPTLPQLGGDVFLTDGGLETDLIFHHDLDLPEFASFVLLDDADATEIMRSYFRDYLRIGSEHGLGLVLETPTWRASSDWGELLGYDAAALASFNRRAVDLVVDLRERDAGAPVVVSGCIGPRGDAYAELGSGDPDEARRYHQPQVQELADAGVDLVSALTLTNVAEATGVVAAARESAIPCVISFTVETDGRLPTGQALADAIRSVDDATDAYAAYFMVNCAHPDHFAAEVLGASPVLDRIRGARANASRLSHEELDEAADLDDGDPVEFGGLVAELHHSAPRLNVLGGCCGTDQRHIEQTALALASPPVSN